MSSQERGGPNEREPSPEKASTEKYEQRRQSDMKEDNRPPQQHTYRRIGARKSNNTGLSAEQ
jgi:hypothetical protein